MSLIKQGFSLLRIKCVYKQVCLTLCSVSLWLVCLVAAWLAWSQVDFLYSSWYRVLGIDQTIATYAPENRFGKESFYMASRQEHYRLFSRIVDSVNNQGNDLENIHYQLATPLGQIGHYPLLTPAEIIHLQDVARLVAMLFPLGGLALLVFAASVFQVYRQGWLLPSLRRQLLVALFAFAAVGGLVVLLGVQEVFYWLHVQVFPAEHQWFFYYQDSLMSTLMQAPNLFAPIAMIWLCLAMFLWVVGMLWLVRWQRCWNSWSGKKNA